MYLSKNGFVIKKDQLTPEEYIEIKRELTCTPITDERYSFSKIDNSYPVYVETQNKLYIPKMYGIKRFGKTSQCLANYLGKKWDRDIPFAGKLYDHQLEPANLLYEECKNGMGGGILQMITGQGKCHALNTPILMYNGSIKLVQDIKVGDLLMGDDSTPRTVLSLARGEDEMYDIIPVKGDKYTVNQEHILCLKNTKRKPYILEAKDKNEIKKYHVKWWEDNEEKSKTHNSLNEANEYLLKIENNHQDIVEISVKDYLEQKNTFKHHFKGYRVGINFPERDVPIDPYMIGYWLGDGTSNGAQITSQDSVVLHFFAHELLKYNLHLTKVKDTYVYGITGYTGKKDSNIFLSTLKNLGLKNNKHIPDIYKINSREKRLKLLAGIIDSDGSLSDNSFDIIQKSEKLMDDIIYLCRSLGFACYKSKQKKGCWYKDKYMENEYFRITISGNTDEIPTLIRRKKAETRKQIKDVLVSGIDVKHVGRGNYYGFMLDGNRRYVMGDFTVTHNTITTLSVLSKLRTKTIIVVNKIPLMRQWEREIKQFLPDARIGFIQGQKNVKIEETDIIIAMLQSLAKIDYPMSFFADIGCCVIDETHNLASRIFSKVLGKLCCKYTIGLSATPKRSDGCEYVFKWHLGDIIYKSEVKRTGLPPIIKLIKLKSEHYKEISTVNKMTNQNQIQYSSMINDLINMPSRNQYIINTILKCMSEKRVLLVLSDRRNHLMTLYKLLEREKVNFTYGLFLGQMNSKKLEVSMACDVILATYSAFSEGVSKRDLNTVILVTPKKYVGHLKNSVKNDNGKMEQIVGRIFRKEHTEKNPMIIDLCDDFSVYRNQSSQRTAFYKSHFTNYQLIKTNVDLDTQKEEEIIQKRIKEHEEEMTKQFGNICLIDD